MKVIHNTSDRLVIDSRPLWPGLLAMTFIMVGFGVGWNMTFENGNPSGVIIGSIFVGMGALFGFVRRNRSSLIGPRDHRNWRKSINSQTRVVHDLADFDRAEVETSSSRQQPTAQSCAHTRHERGTPSPDPRILQRRRRQTDRGHDQRMALGHLFYVLKILAPQA